MTWEIFFFENHAHIAMEKLVQDPFLKNRNSAYLCINSLKCYGICFYCMPKAKSIKTLKLRSWPIPFTTCKAFFKIKGRSGTSLSGSFLHDFWRKIFICCILIIDKVSLSLILEIFDNMCIATLCFPVYDVINFEINLSFLIKPFS